MRTQSPRVYAATANITEQLFPERFSSPPEEIRAIAEDLARYLAMDDFCSRCMVGRGTYGRSLYEEIPSHQRADALFEDFGIRYEKGDCLLLVGRYR